MSPGTGSTPPRRVRVTSPRTAAGRSRRTNIPSEIDAQTRLGEIYLSSLLRVQLRLAARILLALAVLVAGIPVLFWAVPSLLDARVLGMPLSWVLLAFAVYPLLLLLGWAYVRAAERNERNFTDVVERS